MCGGSKGQTKSQQTSTTSATPEAMAAYRDILSRAQDVAATPYQAYEGERVAGFTPYQEQAFGQIAGAQGAGMGTLGEAGELARRGAAQITAEDIQRGMDPYQQQVIQTTMDEMARQNAIEQSRLQGQAITAGAFGGDRAGIAATELAKRQGDVRAATLSSLLSQGYGRAVAQAQADRQAAQVGTGQLMGVAQQEFGMPLSQAQALAGVGTAQQQLAQQQLNVPYQTYLEQRAYPYQQAQWLAGLSTGVGGAMGGTTQAQGTQTPAQPNPFSQILGAGLAIGAMPVTGGGSLFGNFLGGLSDERAKDNIVPVGKLNDGQTVYKYNYKGEPGTHLGLLAQEVEKAHPEAVGEVGGLKMVNYDAATKDAVPHKADGGGLSIPMDGQAVLPYSQGFIPKAMPMRALQAPQASLQMPGEAPDQSKQFVAQAMDLAKSIRDRRQAEMPSAQSWASGTTITPEPTPEPAPEWGYMADGGRVPMQDGGVPVEEEVSPRFNLMPPGAEMKLPEDKPSDYVVPSWAGAPVAVRSKLVDAAPRQTPPAPPPAETKATKVNVPPMALSEFVSPGTALAPLEGRALADVPGLGAAAYKAPMPEPMGLGAPKVAPPAPAKGGFELSPEARQAMMQAGFALMASRSPFLGQAIGEAGMTGVQAYSQAQQLAEQRRKQAESEKIQRERMEVENWKLAGTTKDGFPIFYNVKTSETRNTQTDKPVDAKTEFAKKGKDEIPDFVKKQITESRSVVNEAKSTVSLLEKALSLNEKAYEGPYAGLRGEAMAYLGAEAGKSTSELDNIVTTTALNQLKSVFGGNPTEGERKILLEVQGSSSKTAAVRKQIYERAIAAALAREDYNRRKSEALIDGTFFTKEFVDAPFGPEKYLAQAQEISRKFEKKPEPEKTTAPTKPAQAVQAKPQEAPPLPSGVPVGSLWSNSRQVWRDPSGKLYDASGKPVRQ